MSNDYGSLDALMRNLESAAIDNQTKSWSLENRTRLIGARKAIADLFKIKAAAECQFPACEDGSHPCAKHAAPAPTPAPQPKGEDPEIPSQGSPGTREAVDARVFYRLVADGEVIPEDAESLRDDCRAWGPADRWTIGRKWGNHLMPMRTDGLRNRPFQANASDGAQPREGKASPGRECWVAFGMEEVCHVARKPEEKHHYLVYTRMVEADNQKGGT